MDSLECRLGRIEKPAPPNKYREASVPEILDVDCEYREKAGAGALPTIAPRRFNPTGEAWLPILHTERRRRRYTALFSNTARAHRMKRTRDWVVIYYHDGGGEGQYTVITSRQGPLAGKRIVRGREQACVDYYKKAEVAPQVVSETVAAPLRLASGAN
jgi:hypothetical protein